MNRSLCILRGALWLYCVFTCQSSTAGGKATSVVSETLPSATVSNYCRIIGAGYEDSLTLTRKLQSAIESFLASPDAKTMRAAREAWIHCRTIYLQTEVARFCDGPIEAVEGFINAWPIDENYIDYNTDDPVTGIINLPQKYPAITREVILGANEKGGEKNISIGFHAIEFLLWGQDLSETGPGNRPPSDYIEDESIPARHAGRRREYLRLVTTLLVEHLAVVEREWSRDVPENYRAKFLALPPESALSIIFTGLGSFSGAELGGERLLVPYTTKEQEDEHSCFSDTTHLDFIYDQIGIQNIVLGTFTRADGSRIPGLGLDALIKQVDPQLAATLRAQVEAGLAAFKAIPPPFDEAIPGRDTDPGRVAIKRAIDAMEAQTTSIAKAAKVLGIRLNLK